MSDKYEGLRRAAEKAQTAADGDWEWRYRYTVNNADERAFIHAASPDVILSLLQERDQFAPVEPPQWDDYFRALKLSYPENLTAIYVAKEVYSMFMAALARESPEDAWRRGFIEGATDAAAVLGATMYGTIVPPYSAPKGESE